jgi:hypothetical protein
MFQKKYKKKTGNDVKLLGECFKCQDMKESIFRTKIHKIKKIKEQQET